MLWSSTTCPLIISQYLLWTSHTFTMVAQWASHATATFCLPCNTGETIAVCWLLAFAYFQNILNHSGERHSASGVSEPRETCQNISNRKGPDSKRDRLISQRRCLNGGYGKSGRDRECVCVREWDRDREGKIVWDREWERERERERQRERERERNRN